MTIHRADERHPLGMELLIKSFNMTIIEAREMLIATRKSRGISQKQLATLANVSQSWISEFENREGVGWVGLTAYANALDLELSIECTTELAEG